MSEKSARERLSDKLNTEYAAYIRRWEATLFDVVMQDVEKLMAARQIKSHLTDAITEADAVILLYEGVTLESLIKQYGQRMDTQGLLRRCISPSSDMNFGSGESPTAKELPEGSPVQAHAGTPGTEVQTEANMILCQRVLRGGMTQ